MKYENYFVLFTALAVQAVQGGPRVRLTRGGIKWPEALCKHNQMFCVTEELAAPLAYPRAKLFV